MWGGDPAAPQPPQQLPPVTPWHPVRHEGAGSEHPRPGAAGSVFGSGGAEAERQEHEASAGEGERGSPAPRGARPPRGCKGAQKPPPQNAWGHPSPVSVLPGCSGPGDPRPSLRRPGVPPAVPSASRRACGAASPGSAGAGGLCPPPPRGCSFSCPQPGRASRWPPPIGPSAGESGRGWGRVSPAKEPRVGSGSPSAASCQPGLAPITGTGAQARGGQCGVRRGAPAGGVSSWPLRYGGGGVNTSIKKYLAEPRHRGWPSLPSPRSHLSRQGGLGVSLPSPNPRLQSPHFLPVPSCPPTSLGGCSVPFIWGKIPPRQASE